MRAFEGNDGARRATWRNRTRSENRTGSHAGFPRTDISGADCPARSVGQFRAHTIGERAVRTAADFGDVDGGHGGVMGGRTGSEARRRTLNRREEVVAAAKAGSDFRAGISSPRPRARRLCLERVSLIIIISSSLLPPSPSPRPPRPPPSLPQRLQPNLRSRSSHSAPVSLPRRDPLSCGCCRPGRGVTGRTPSGPPHLRPSRDRVIRGHVEGERTHAT